MSTTAVFGPTGLVGANIVSIALDSNAFSSVYTISRRAPKSEGKKLHAIIEPDNSTWASKFAAITPTTDVVFSAVGTTRAAAGGIANQWKIDHDLNIELAKAAKAAGVKTFVFISSTGTRSRFNAALPYSRMKVGVEDAVKDLDFETSIILRPALIMGAREVEHSGGPLMNTLVRGLGKMSQGLQDALGADADVIGRAAVVAATLASEGKAPSKFWVLEQADIIKMGKQEATKETTAAAEVKVAA